MDKGEVITGLGSRGSVIHAIPEAERRGLGPEELRLIECVGAGSTVGDALSCCGLPEARAIAVLLGLRLRGLINPGPRRTDAAPAGWARPSPTPRPPMAQTAGSAGLAGPAVSRAPAALDEAALREAIELDDDRKREILLAESRCGLDHFAALGLPPGAGPAEVKKAYYELSRRFHPDRFFGKKLGSFKARIDRVFKRLAEAQAVLSDPSRRAAYLEANPQLAPAARPRSAFDEARASERRARLKRHPYLKQHAKLHELVAKGRALLAQGDFSRALTDLALAAQADPENQEIQALLLQARRGGDKVRAGAEFSLGVNAETLGDFNLALAQFRRAVGLAPDNAEFCHRLACRLVQSGTPDELKEAHQHARRAVELASDNVDFRLTLARVLASAGLEKNAIREYEVVLKLRPGDVRAREQLKRLRSRF